MNETKLRKRNLERLFLVFALVGSILNLLLAIGFTLWSLYLSSSARSDEAALSSWATLAFVVLFIAGVPGVYWAIRSWKDKPSLAQKPNPRWAMALIILPVGICLGSASFLGLTNSFLIQALGYMLTISAMVFAVILAARWVGPPLSPRRAWGHFMIGLYGIPLASLIVEVLLFIPSLILLGLGLLFSTEGRALLEGMTTSFSNDPQFINESIQNLTMEPWVVALIFINLAVLIPIAEETFKTMAIWPLLRRKIIPGQGFLAGAIAGAGLALFEALFVSEPGQAWLVVIIGRSGTTLMHVFTAGITNWALVGAMQNRKWGRFALTFFAAVALHGIWNASSLSVGFAGMIMEMDPAGSASTFAVMVSCAGTLAMMALSGLALVGIPWFGRKLAKSESPQG